MNIEIKYDGECPSLCSGHLYVIVDGKEWDFGSCCLSSGGSVTFDSDWSEDISHGPWSVYEWPDEFPEELKLRVLQAINDQIEHGCCGGCI